MQNASQQFIVLGFDIECWTILSALRLELVVCFRFQYFTFIYFIKWINCFSSTADRFDLVATLDRKHLSDSTTRLFAIHDALGEILNRVSSFVIHSNRFSSLFVWIGNNFHFTHFFRREFGLTLLFLMISTSFHITMCIYSVVAELLGSNVSADFLNAFGVISDAIDCVFRTLYFWYFKRFGFFLI